jgi:Tfp pilus assembly protein PilF
VLDEPEVRIEQLDAAIKDDPSNGVLHFRRAVIYKRLGKTDKALADFTEAIRLDPMKSRFYLARARLYHEQNQPDLAQADIKKAQNVDPTAPRHVHFNDGKGH